MIQQILNITSKNFMNVGILDGVRRVQEFFYEKNIECFAANEDGKLVGVVTKKELVVAHPNRIIADVMSHKYKFLKCYTHIWEIKYIFDLNKDIDVIFLGDKDKIIGFVTSTILNIELAKHIDLLTGLYKSEYIFYNAYDLIRREKDTTIIFIDLNKFGYIDKKYGHIKGDAILKCIAKVLNENIPSDTYLCRYGGDEFAILTPYSMDASRLLAEKIINDIKSFEFPNDIPVSVSIGIAACRVPNDKVENIVDLIKNMVNNASLASTKAKQTVDSSIIIVDTEINEIA